MGWQQLGSAISRVLLTASHAGWRRAAGGPMEVLYPHCAGLDVHKDTVVACVRHMVNGTVKREVRSFKTTTTELLALSDWLRGREMHPHRDGGDRRLLEAGMAHPERRRFLPGAGERGTCQERARAQDRR